MKTTFDIADNILEKSRRMAKTEHITLKELVEEGLSLVLEKRSRQNTVQVKPVTFKGQGLSEPFRNADWARIRDTAYGDIQA